MTTNAINPESISVARVVAAIVAAPGVRTKQLADACGYSMSFTQKVLRVMVVSGIGGCVPLDGVDGCRARGWYVGADYTKASADWAELAADRLKARRKKAARFLKERRNNPAIGGAMPVQRKLSANTNRPLPFVVKAANSVFALGG